MECIKKNLFEIHDYIDDLQYLDNVYTVEIINSILKKIEEFSLLCTFEELILLEKYKYNISESGDRIYLPVGYLFNKNLYEKYFKVKLELNDKDYFYAFCITIFNESHLNVYKKINEVIPNVLSIGVYNAILALDAQKLIFEDKLDKGIVIKIITKNKDGDIVDIEYEERDGMYEIIYGEKE